jgi:PTS system N-acetylglucosamine-specific IIC component
LRQLGQSETPAARVAPAPTRKQLAAPDLKSASVITDDSNPIVAADLLTALGGPGNVRELEALSSRLRVAVRDTTVVDESRIRLLGARGVAKPGLDCVHVLIGPGASRTCESIQVLLAPR